ncbi:TRAP transporter small permease subunit [Chitinimonas sp. BJB300]|uniref:TRAP transporter small permease subunit n=1 Tax=Chitinimonas sp. BJB300 TaxID=1559339 RepID=UPI000C0C8976|nr:TRAP transporter small permease subunit [Chitinimonas sp. BJB300]PHV10914.1 sugar transporter [Chitinimonas sp. BJB300]TSJ89954.1 TRAP transporter small permease subunit [Chitinimonas sp. BJB300]
MQLLLKLAGWIDTLNERIGHLAKWLVLICALISASNAVVRKAFDMSSNAFLEIQWYLFSAIFLLGAGYTLKHNEHIRIDLILGRLSPRKQAIIDIIGGLCFLLPMAVVILYFSWPIVGQMFASGEQSPDAGGLIRWPVWALIPIGFGLLILQVLAEVIKRIAFLKGLIPNPAEKQDSQIEEAIGQNLDPLLKKGDQP